MKNGKLIFRKRFTNYNKQMFYPGRHGSAGILFFFMPRIRYAVQTDLMIERARIGSTLIRVHYIGIYSANFSIAFAKPHSSLVSVTYFAAAFASALPFAMAMP